jgi:hypothetical protein
MCSGRLICAAFRRNGGDLLFAHSGAERIGNWPAGKEHCSRPRLALLYEPTAQTSCGRAMRCSRTRRIAARAEKVPDNRMQTNLVSTREPVPLRLAGGPAAHSRAFILLCVRHGCKQRLARIRYWVPNHGLEMQHLPRIARFAMRACVYRSGSKDRCYKRCVVARAILGNHDSYIMVV